MPSIFQHLLRFTKWQVAPGLGLNAVYLLLLPILSLPRIISSRWCFAPVLQTKTGKFRDTGWFVQSPDALRRTAVASDWYQGSIYQVWCLTSDREHSMGSSQWVQASTSHQIWQPVFYCYNKISNIQQIIKSVFALQCLRLGRERWCQHLLRAFLLPHGGRGHDRTAESVPAQWLLSLATKPLTPPWEPTSPDLISF